MVSGRTIEHALQTGICKLGAVSDTPRLDAEILLRAATGFSRIAFLVSPDMEISEEAWRCYEAYLERRMQHESVAHIVRCKEFWSLEFEVSCDVLVPRPETELVVERALDYLSTLEGVPVVLDLGTGSGCICVALAWEYQRRGREIRIVALDKSRDAIEIARNNAVRHGVGHCMSFVVSDWLSSFKTDIALFDVVLSNPPYLSSAEFDVEPSISAEPRMALVAGSDGLDHIRHLMHEVPRVLKPAGVFLCEIGEGQSRKIDGFLPKPTRAQFFHDLAGIERVVQFVK